MQIKNNEGESMNRNSRIFSFLMLGIASAFASTSALAQFCSTQLTNKKGDEVTVVGKMTTGDPNENGEGELPLNLSSSGGELNGLVRAYEVPQSFTYTAVAANETVSGDLAGADGDDEACSLNTTINQSHLLSQGLKDFLSKLSTASMDVSLGSGIIAAACVEGGITAPYCGLPFGTAAALLAAASYGSQQLVEDPPDSNFTQIAVAQPPTTPKLGPLRNIPQPVALQFDKFLETQATIVGLEQALYTTVNRASSASSAGSTYWFEEQSEAAKKFERDLIVQFGISAETLDTLSRAINKFNLDTTITPAQVLDFEISVAYSGLPQTEVVELQNL
jgi:hypothetical protein